MVFVFLCKGLSKVIYCLIYGKYEKYMSAIHEAMACNRGITCKIINSLIKSYLSCFYFVYFSLLYQKVFRGKIFFYLRKNHVGH